MPAIVVDGGPVGVTLVTGFRCPSQGGPPVVRSPPAGTDETAPGRDAPPGRIT